MWVVCVEDNFFLNTIQWIKIHNVGFKEIVTELHLSTIWVHRHILAFSKITINNIISWRERQNNNVFIIITNHCIIWLKVVLEEFENMPMRGFLVLKNPYTCSLSIHANDPTVKVKQHSYINNSKKMFIFVFVKLIRLNSFYILLKETICSCCAYLSLESCIFLHLFGAIW